MKNILTSLILLLIWTSSALASVVTKCDSPKGWSYYVANALVQKKDAGWQQDAVSKGSYLVTRDEDGKYDIIFSDALNRTISSREDGGEVVVISKSDNHLVLIVAYPAKNVETWYFRINLSGVGELTMSQARYGDDSIIIKHSLMRAACSK